MLSDRMKKLIAQIALVFAILAPIAACNTMEGAGKDVQDAGDALEDAAD